ncbi:type II secretion system protein N [Thiomicrorhabdus cannonii]|uniref:type II secretion system protein N n=1 Tax=Thiomicrorhabdus cannonii TaxID=2748011 RepID=UPI0015BAA70A|nr:type II secretion system protein N [Thiomicrorhabdus cannonii]
MMGLLFLVVLAWQVGALIALQLGAPQTPDFPTLDQKEKPAEIQRPHGVASHLFGQPLVAPPTKTAASLKVEMLAPTQLRLKLLGTIVSGHSAVAIIESAGVTLVVAEGEPVTKNVGLVKVFADEVIIEHRGKREKLQMEQAGERLISSVQADSVVLKALTAEQKETLQSIGQIIREQPLSVSKYIRFEPLNKQGKLNGVKIWPSEQKEVFDALGLQPGDVLLGINGQSIEEIGQGSAGWQALLERTQLELQLERNGQRLSLSVDLN